MTGFSQVTAKALFSFLAFCKAPVITLHLCFAFCAVAQQLAQSWGCFLTVPQLGYLQACFCFKHWFLAVQGTSLLLVLQQNPLHCVNYGPPALPGAAARAQHPPGPCFLSLPGPKQSRSSRFLAPSATFIAEQHRRSPRPLSPSARGAQSRQRCPHCGLQHL